MLSLLLLVLLLNYSDCKISYSKGGARQRFEDKFEKTCSKYPFVHKYVENLKNPSSDYVIFVFHEAGQKAHGGLGDRVAGIITAMAYALRTGRTFLMQGDSAFEETFRPYYPPNMKDFVSEPEKKYSWKSWEWANWSREFSHNMSSLHCINPKPKMHFCALDHNHFAQHKVIKYYGNRSYLCRWLIKASLGMRSELAKTLDMHVGSDLYELGGCLLRLAMWPTERLWEALDESLDAQFSLSDTFASVVSKSDISAASTSTSGVVPTTKQVGFHFRCGDSSFTAAAGGAPNPECYLDPSGKIPWKGTGFSDDHSMDSPLDAAQCGRQILTSQAQNTPVLGTSSAVGGAEHRFVSAQQAHGVLAYIASDNGDSSKQINSTLNWGLTIKPPDACHMDLQKNTLCTLMTSLHWFMLSLSDVIVMQALIKPGESVYSNSPETAHLSDDEPAPISAFSRYAAIYSLSDHVIRYGKGCRTANTTQLSYQTHGNWVCDPRMFY